MTSVLPTPAATGPGDATSGTGPAPGRWTRVGVHTPRGRLDVALPADVAVAELVPMVRELLGRASTDTPQAWRFTGPAGGPLPADATLDELGIREGELLHLGPPRPAPAPPVLDDAAETVAGAVRGAADVAGTARWSGTAAAVLATAAAGAVLSTMDGSWRPWACALAAAGAVGALLVAHRGRDDDRLTTAAALCAVPAAATAGLTALPAPAGAGALLLAAAGTGLAAAAGQAIARAVSPVLLAVALAASGTAAAALARLLLEAPVTAVAAGLAAPALAAGPLLPRLALRLARIPAPAVPTDAESVAGAERVLPGAELTARAELARGLHTGTLAGTAVAAAGAAAVAATGGWTGGLLLVVTAAVLLLRARALVEPAAARILTGAAVVAVATAAVPAALALDPAPRLAVAAGLLLAVGAGAAAARTTPSPPARRALDVCELVLTAAAVPAALAAMGLFALVRTL
ncbi:type VII secretion integral membrane protein EccD [Pseudonocardia sp. UM4_GMWB1]|uniref:type VII secretion integral membrane protein EccD n=1 Tax=Pseudonocardia sp. UM4_GMWB1 TaxID=2212989 RepID=UPI00307EA23A